MTWGIDGGDGSKKFPKYYEDDFKAHKGYFKVNVLTKLDPKIILNF